MLSLSITFLPACAERTNLLSQTSLKGLIELSKKCRWLLVISVLDPPEQIEAMFRKLDASQIAGISATKFAFRKQRKEPLENVSHVRTAVARFNQVKGFTDAERSAFYVGAFFNEPLGTRQRQAARSTCDHSSGV